MTDPTPDLKELTARLLNSELIQVIHREGAATNPIAQAKLYCDPAFAHLAQEFETSLPGVYVGQTVALLRENRALKKVVVGFLENHLKQVTMVASSVFSEEQRQKTAETIVKYRVEIAELGWLDGEVPSGLGPE